MGTVDDSATSRTTSPQPADDAQASAATPSRGRVHIDLVDITGRLAESEIQWLAGRGLEVLKHLSLVGRLSVKIINDQEMSEAHLEFLDDPSTTDVLTFDMSDEDGLDVDVMCCIDEAERRAAEHGHDRARELLLYVVHGILHASGFDDIEESDRLRMHAREDEILTAIGVGATYDRPGPRADGGCAS
ncbi:MAG TPA: rRNA maturation RNase YbeY [Phycisphaerales bacterium]|nr:rRNA maturation RNase YbeY [Phycisphaerales bacterium]